MMEDIDDSYGIESIIEDDGWNVALDDAARLAASCYDAAAQSEPALRKASAALLLTDDATVQSLNARFRGKDAPTNVLAFPAGQDDVGTQAGFLGDIALARETCLREAEEKGISAADHAAHLIVHGVLHLIGYDHQNDEDAAQMEQREREALKRLCVADPYAPVLDDEMETI